MPAPGTASAVANPLALPVFLSPTAPTDATPLAILSCGSTLLHGMSRPSPPRVSRREAPLMGFHFPSTLEVERVHVRAGCPARLRLQVPPCRLRCRSQVFPTSQRLFSSPQRPAIFRQVTLLGFCLSGSYSFHEAPDAHRRRCALLTLLPWIALSPFLGGDILGRISRMPRMLRLDAFVRLQSLRPRGNRSSVTEPRLMSK